MSLDIAIFGGSALRKGAEGYAAARDLGRMLAESGYGIVNGGYGGAMAATGRGAKDAGGRVTGVTVPYYGSAMDYVDIEEQAADFWERTQRMLDLGAGFVALPGSTGTLAEVACAWESINKELIEPKPLVLFGEFWRPLVEMMCPKPSSKAWCGGAMKLVTTPSEAVRFLDDRLGRTATA